MFLQKAVASGGSNLARLGELSELGGKLLPYCPINRGMSEGEWGSALLVLRNHLKLVRKIVSVKKIQAEALPWVISRRFSTVLQDPSFVLRFLQSTTGKYLKLSFSIHSMYPWWSTFCFMYFYSRLHLLFIPPFDVLKPFI